MKKLLMTAMVAATVVACTTKQNVSEQTGAQQLAERLDSLQKKGIMFRQDRGTTVDRAFGHPSAERYYVRTSR